VRRSLRICAASASAGGFGFGVLDDAPDEGGGFGVAGIKDALKVLGAAEEGVGFINDEGGVEFLDDAEEGGGADVGGNDRPTDEEAEDGEESGFAATFLRRFDAKIGADVAELESIGVENPEGDGLGGVGRENDEAAEDLDEGIEGRCLLLRQRRFGGRVRLRRGYAGLAGVSSFAGALEDR
jgi:hypothetical protein